MSWVELFYFFNMDFIQYILNFLGINNVLDVSEGNVFVQFLSIIILFGFCVYFFDNKNHMYFSTYLKIKSSSPLLIKKSI